MTPSYYLNQCWPTIDRVLLHSPEGNFMASTLANVLDNDFENYTMKITTTSPGGKWVHINFIISCKIFFALTAYYFWSANKWFSFHKCTIPFRGYLFPDPLKNFAFCLVWTFSYLQWTPEGRRLVTGASSGEFTLWNGLTFNFETILQVCELKSVLNRECYSGGHYRDYYHGVLSLSQVTATPFEGLWSLLLTSINSNPNMDR